MTLIIIIATSLTIVCAYLMYRIIKVIWDYFYVRSLPGPPLRSLLSGTQIIEDESAQDFNLLFNFRKRCSWKQPKLCRFATGPLMNMLVSHPDSVKTIINENYPKSSFYLNFFKWIGDGLLTSKGEKWIRHRKLLTPAFHYQILDGFFAVYTECVDVMLDLWAIESADNGHVVLQDWISYLTLDIILQCICSVKTDCQIKREQLQYVQDVAALTRIVLTRSKYPEKYYFDYIFNRTQLGREFDSTCKRAKQFTYDVIQERKRLIGESMNYRESNYRDFLDILLHASDPALTDEEIRDEVDTFVFEGHDTTASALTWTLYLLAKHTEYQDMCRQEVFKVCDGIKALDKSSIANLKFLSMCIKESLRMFPPVISTIRRSPESAELGGHALPAGYMVIIGINHMHNNPDIWHNPSEFNPYRFSEENIDKIVPYSYIPFSAGPRNCIGQIMALHELNYVVARILTRFNLTLPRDFPEEMEYETNILLKPKIPMKILLSSL